MSAMDVGKKTVVGFFNDMSYIDSVVQDLEKAGIRRDQISVVAGDSAGKYKDHTSGSGAVGSGATGGAGTGAAIGGGLGLIAGLAALAIPGVGPVVAVGPIAAALTGAGVGAAAGGIIGGLRHMGMSHKEAHYYAEGIRRGGVLVSVETDDDEMANRAADIMDDHGAEDIEQRAAEWKKGGWAGPPPTETESIPDRIETSATPRESGRAATVQPETRQPETRQPETGQARSIPVVEEQLKVGKREVPRGGVRVFTHMTERPVEETVNLRDERINVERRPVDRPASEADFAAFREVTIELTEISEEPVVQKEARVVEEVEVGKQVEQRDETIRDTVRKTNVDVEQMGNDDAEFRRDFESRYAGTGRQYDPYAPAYTYGSTLGNDPRNRQREWKDVESDARSDWEKRGHGAWEDFKEAIRHGWDKVRGRR
jgi:uncharacterized protein (TIGR02271 family)